MTRGAARSQLQPSIGEATLTKTIVVRVKIRTVRPCFAVSLVILSDSCASITLLCFSLRSIRKLICESDQPSLRRDTIELIMYRLVGPPCTLKHGIDIGDAGVDHGQR